MTDNDQYNMYSLRIKFSAAFKELAFKLDIHYTTARTRNCWRNNN